MSAKPADASRPQKVHIADTAITRQNWYKHVNWLNVTLIIGVPVYGCIQALWVPLQLKTAIWAVIYYFFTGLGITAGEHHLSHRPRIKTNHFCHRIPSSLGALCLLRSSSPAYLARRCGRWCRRRFHPLVGS